jgi:anthranilate synthase component 2
MAIAHQNFPAHGVQFHPESIASEHGQRILKNFLDITDQWNASRRTRSSVKASAEPATPARAAV